jgi:hypothetical protein
MANNTYSKNIISPMMISRDIVSARFIGVPVAGFFEFPAIQNVFIPLKNTIAIFEEINFSANIGALSYQAAVSDNPRLNLFYGDEFRPVNRYPIPLLEYWQGQTWGQASATEQNSNEGVIPPFRARISGRIQQTANVINDLGANDLILTVSFLVAQMPQKTLS